MSQSQIRETNIRRVLDVSQGLFLKYGVENTMISTIAEASELTPTSIYRYFQNKSNLAIAVWHDSLTTFYNEFYLPEYRKSCNADSTGLEMFATAMDTYIKLYTLQPEWLEYTREMFMLAAKETENEYVEEPKKFWEDFFKEIPIPALSALKKGQTDKSIRGDINIYEVYQLITNVYTGARTYEVFTTGLTSIDVIKFTKEMVCEYIKNN